MDYYRVIAISVGGKKGKIHWKKDNEILPASAFIESNIPSLIKYKSIEKVEKDLPKVEKPEPTKVTHEPAKVDKNLDSLTKAKLVDYAKEQGYPSSEWVKLNKADLLAYLKGK